MDHLTVNGPTGGDDWHINEPTNLILDSTTGLDGRLCRHQPTFRTRTVLRASPTR